MKPIKTLLFSTVIILALVWNDPEKVLGISTEKKSEAPSNLSANPPPTAQHPTTSTAPQTDATRSDVQPISSLLVPLLVSMGFLLSILCGKFPIGSGPTKDESPADVISNLIREVEESSGYSRNDARAKAKAWLEGNVICLEQDDILLAKTHFGYLLPPGWGVKA